MALAVPEPEGVSVGDDEGEGDPVGVRLGVARWLGVTVRVACWDGVGAAEPDCVRVRELDGLRDAVCVRVCERDAAGVGVAEGLGSRDAEPVALGLPLELDDPLALGLPDGEALDDELPDGVGEAVGVRLAVRLRDCEGVAEGDVDRVLEGLRVSVVDGVPWGEALGDGDAPWLLVGDREAAALGLDVPDPLTVPPCEPDADKLGEPLGDGVGENVVDCA